MEVKPLFPTSKIREILAMYKIFSMHSIKSNFDEIKCILKGILGESFPFSENLVRPGPVSKFTDIDVMALSLTAEAMSIESENKLFHILTSTYKNDFPNLISRRQFNDRRRLLDNYIEKANTLMADELDKFRKLYITDSMPVEICRYSRKGRSSICKEDEDSAPNLGYCAAQKKRYYGYKLHAFCTEAGTIVRFKLVKASVHDIRVFKEESKNFKDCMILGDKGYQSKIVTEDLLKNNNVILQAPFRKNQKEKHPLIAGFGRKRKRIETVFSQLCDQFLMQKNYAKTFKGLKTRIMSKICGMTILQYLNHLKDRPIGQIKYALK